MRRHGDRLGARGLSLQKRQLGLPVLGSRNHSGLSRRGVADAAEATGVSEIWCSRQDSGHPHQLMSHTSVGNQQECFGELGLLATVHSI